MRAVVAIARKDLLVELRTKESVPAMALFAVTTFVIFHFGLDRDRLEGELAAGVLWVTLLFAAILGINRLFVAEREQGGFDGILMAPIERTSLLLAKAGALLVYLVALELIALPVFALFFIDDGFWEAVPRLVAGDAAGGRRARGGGRAAGLDRGPHARPRPAAADPAAAAHRAGRDRARRRPRSRSCRSPWTRRAWGNGWLFWPFMICVRACWPTHCSTSSWRIDAGLHPLRQGPQAARGRLVRC